MKLNNEICISFLQGSGWMRNHDEKVKNGIIDKNIPIFTGDDRRYIDNLINIVE